MSPAPRQVSRKLPLSPEQLSAFDQARKAQTATEREKAVDAIVTASFSDGVSMKSEAANYVLNRLLNGVSVSGNQTRLNLSITLIAFIRTLRKAEPKTTEKAMISSILKLYGPDGSFKVDYAGGERERAIGTVAACAALARAYNAKLKPITLKEIITLLRPCTTGKCAKWRLGSASVQVVSECLQACDVKAVQEVCGKNLWRWCEDVKRSDVGLSLIFTLLHLKIASQNAVQQIYPNLHSVAEALASTFKTGFPFSCDSWDKAELVPLPWKLALNYAFSPDGQKHLGGIDKFWKLVVVEGLIHSGNGMEKKAVALGLVNLAVPLIRDESTFTIVFDSSLSDLIKSRRIQVKPPKLQSVEKENRLAAALRRVRRSIVLLGEAVINRVTDPASKESSLFQWFILWAVRNGNMPHLVSLAKLDTMLEKIQTEHIRNLFPVLVNEFSSPKNQTSPSIVQTTRIQAFEFALKLTSKLPSLFNDVVRIFLFYGVCDDSCYQSQTVSKQEQVRLDLYKAPSNVSLLCNSFPIPSPPLSMETASSVKSKLNRYIANIHDRDVQATWISFCYNHLKLILSWKWTKPRTRHDLEDEDKDTITDEVRDTQNILVDLIEPVLLNLSKARKNAQKGFIDAMQLLLKFTGLALLTPITDSSIQAGHDIFCIYIARELFEITSLLQTDGNIGAGNNREVENDETERKPDAIERLTKLLCEICKRSGIISHHMIHRIIAEMDFSLDDRVVAVLFDAMDEILQPNFTKTDARELEDSDESNEDGEDPEVVEESDFESDMQAEEGGHEETQGTVPAIDDNQESADEKPAKDASGEDSSSDGNVDMDVDDEDPAVLEALDKRLLTHMKLVLQERKRLSRRKQKPKLKSEIIHRILKIVELVAKNLRLRLVSNYDDGRTGIVFLDLLCRLNEFAMSDASHEGHFLKIVCGIVSKHMLLPLSLLQEKVADKETSLQIADRFFSALSSCTILKSLSHLEEQTISKSAACIVGVAALLSDTNYEQFVPRYQNLLKVMLTTTSIVKPRMFSSFFNKAPSASLSLFLTICEVLESPDRTQKQLGRASTIIMQLAKLTEQNNVPARKRKEFWVAFRHFLDKKCEARFKRWGIGGIQNIVQVVHFGCTRKFMVLSDSVVKILQEILNTKIPQKSRQKFAKLLDLAFAEVKQSEVTEDEHEQKAVSKKRKLE